MTHASSGTQEHVMVIPQAQPARPSPRAITIALAAVLAAPICACHTAQTPHTKPAAQTTTLTSAEPPFPAPPVLAGGAPDIATLVARVSPSVVNITATQEVRLPKGTDPLELFFGPTPSSHDGHGSRGRVLRRRGLGSGFILDDRGHVVTNAHVVENATTVRVTLADERELEAKVKGRDERLDLAVLELQGAKDLPRVALGRSGSLRVGEYVVAIGNPFGLGNTVTMGIVSAKGRELGAGPYDDFIQTDASINPGNSGGPLFDLEGRVVGISTAMAAGQGIGFAIPVDALEEVLPQLLAKGFVSRGRLGVAVQAVDAPLARALGLDEASGALVGEVEPGSPAEKAGIRPGDVIVALDDTSVVHGHDLPRFIGRHAPGTKVSIKLIGQGAKSRSVDVTLDQLRDHEREHGRGMPAAGDPAPAARGRGDLGLELGDDPRAGIVVVDVLPGSEVAEELEPGDVILEVNGSAPKSAREAETRIRGTTAGRPALLKVQRYGRTGFVAIERK